MIECTLCISCVLVERSASWGKEHQEIRAREQLSCHHITNAPGAAFQTQHETHSTYARNQADQLCWITSSSQMSEVGKQLYSCVIPSTLRFQLSIRKTSDYTHINHCPIIEATKFIVVTDTGAQFCLWGQADFYHCCFKQTEQIPV